MNYLFTVVFFAWVGTEMVLSSRLRASRKEAGNHDRRTLVVIWFTTVSSIGLAALIAYFTDFPIVRVPEFRYVGIAVILLGMLLRIVSIVTLGRFFTYNVAIREGHALITTGVYRWVRHPAYTGLLISFSGYGLALNNWVGLAVAFLPVFCVMIRRIKIEEVALASEFGDVYTAYQRNSRRLLPWIY
jgi:protein-S-isoprenylcysteine O-methyltransferase Ste14